MDPHTVLPHEFMHSREMKRTTNKILQSRRRKGAKQGRKAAEKGSKAARQGKKRCNAT